MNLYTLIIKSTHVWILSHFDTRLHECWDTSRQELNAFKELAKILLGLSDTDIAIAIKNADFIEVKP